MLAIGQPRVFIYETPIGYQNHASDQVGNAELAANNANWCSVFRNALSQALDIFDPSFSALVVPLTTDDVENRNAQPLLDKAADLTIPKALITFPRANTDDLIRPGDVVIDRVRNSTIVPKLTVWLMQLANKNNNV